METAIQTNHTRISKSPPDASYQIQFCIRAEGISKKYSMRTLLDKMSALRDVIAFK
jgi:hypothetical protein